VVKQEGDVEYIRSR